MQTFTEAVAEVRAYIADKLAFGLSDEAITAMAEQYVERGIEKGANDCGEMSAEISGRDSRSGNPIPFTFQAVAE